jgi:hypothetical protein
MGHESAKIIVIVPQGTVTVVLGGVDDYILGGLS